MMDRWVEMLRAFKEEGAAIVFSTISGTKVNGSARAKVTLVDAESDMVKLDCTHNSRVLGAGKRKGYTIRRTWKEAIRISQIEGLGYAIEEKDIHDDDKTK